MRKRLPKALITGGAGFIGSAFVRQAIMCGRYKVAVVDKLTYAADLARLGEVRGKYSFHKVGICDSRRLENIFKMERPEIILHFAAETHVDRSILDSQAFIRTNINGTQNLLDLSRKYRVNKFIHISTDEVYGEIRKGEFTENSPLKPNSPYAASKAAADLLIRSYVRTYGFPAIIIRPSNNYGPWQYPEKFIPRAILRMIKGEKIPVYARGKNVREWLFVEDCAEGIFRISEKGRPGEVYNLGSQEERRNIEVARKLVKLFGRDKDSIEFVKDRPGHDFRYSLNSLKAMSKIGWRPKVDFDCGLKRTLDWCLKNRDWLLSKYTDIARLYKNV